MRLISDFLHLIFKVIYKFMFDLYDRKKFINIDDYKIAYEDIGNGETVIIFIHGFPTSTKTWYEVIDYLYKDYRCISLDLLGYGDSDKPVNADYSIPAQAILISKFIKELKLNKPVVLVGHSMGGGMCLTIAAEKLINISKLLIIDPACYPQKLPWFFLGLKIPIFPLLVLRKIPPKVAYHIVRNTAYDKARMKSYEHMKNYIYNVQKAGAAEAFVKTANHINKGDINSLSEKYKDISISTQIIWGKNDRIIPLNFAYRLNKDILNSNLDVLEHCGHCPQEEYPEVVAKAIKKLLNKDA